MREISLILGTSNDCSYLPRRSARLAFVDPRQKLDIEIYSALAPRGFRRSGDMIYRPHCDECRACTPIRIPAALFTPNRAQNRVWRHNRDLEAILQPPDFSEEHYRLYVRYLKSRHEHDDSVDSTPEQYMDFLGGHWSETAFVEFRQDGKLMALAVVDRIDQALSAVYTFFDPDYRGRSLGVYAVLWQIAQARRLGLDWVYLGFWIADCRKMNYKDQYRPLQALIDGTWRNFEKGEKIPA